MPPRTPRRSVFVVATLFVGAVFLGWWLVATDPQLPAAPATGAAPPTDAAAIALPAARTLPVVRTPADDATPDASPHAGEAAAGLAAWQLRVRLRGLHAEAPWTGEVHFDWQGNDDTAETGYRVFAATGRPDAQGLVLLPVPAWHATASKQQGRLRAEQTNYLPVEHRWSGPLDPAHEIEIDVQVTASLVGRVVTARGDVVAGASLCVFSRAGPDGIDQRLGQGNTRTDGSYRLRVPPGVPLLVVATPLLAGGVREREWTGEDGAIQDAGLVLDHLLPAALTTSGRIGAATALPDLVLAEAAHVAGVVRWSDGAPVPGARVWIQPRGGKALGISDHLALRTTPNGQTAPITSTTTDAQGAFRLPAVPGVPCELRIDSLDGATIVGDNPAVEAVAGRSAELRIPRPVVLRVFHAGLRVPVAAIEAEVEWPKSATGWLRLPVLALDEDGELRAVSVHPRLRVRAAAGARLSPWTDIATAPARVVDLALEDTPAGELLVEFLGDHPLRSASFGWTRDDGTTGRRLLGRAEASGPFRLLLAPGRYRLRIGAAGDEGPGQFLLPIEREVEISAASASLTLPAVFGGRFTVWATDSRGLHVAGRCRVLDADGVDRSAPFVVRDGGQGTRVGAPGDLLEGGPNEFAKVLPGGDYLLDFGFAEHGARQQRVTIRPFEGTEVRVRLP